MTATLASILNCTYGTHHTFIPVDGTDTKLWKSLNHIYVQLARISWYIPTKRDLILTQVDV